MSRGVARLGDSTHGMCKIHKKKFKGTIISASPDTTCNGRGVARLGDTVLSDCGHKGTIISASPDTTCNGRGVARLGDNTGGDYIATIISASPDTDCN